MAAVAWVSFVFLVVVIVGGVVVTTSRTIRTWRAFRSLREALGGTLDDILRRTADVEARLAGAGERAVRLEEALARLERSRTRAAVLAAAFGEVRASVDQVRGAVPHK